MSFSENKCKVNLKLSLNRLKIQKNKKQNEIKAARKAIAELLRAGKEDVARVKVEAIVRDDMLLQALEIIELFIELVLSRIGLLKMQAGCPFDLKEAICTIIYCAPRLEAAELLEVRSQFIIKYGKPFASEAMENKGNCVNEKVIHKLSVITPDDSTVVQYLESIAKEGGVNWAPPVKMTAPDNVGLFPPPPYMAQPMVPNQQYPQQFPPYGQQPGYPPQHQYPYPQQPMQPFSPPPAGGHPVFPGASYGAPPPANSPLQFPSVPPQQQQQQFLPPPGGASPQTPGEPGLDDLMARFNRLKSENL